MSEPRLPETSKSPGDLPALGHAALRQLVLKVLAHHSGSAVDAEALAKAARHVFDDLAEVSTPLIGQLGVDALTARALHLAQREHPWLADRPESERTNKPFAQVIVNLGRQNPKMAVEGTAAMVAIFAGLLVTFIGAPLTMSLLRKAWPAAFSNLHEET